MLKSPPFSATFAAGNKAAFRHVNWLTQFCRQPAFQGRDPTPCPGPETLTVHPTAIHSRRSQLPAGAPVFCGRAVGAESPNCFSIFFAGGLWVLADGHHELKQAGGYPRWTGQSGLRHSNEKWSCIVSFAGHLSQQNGSGLGESIILTGRSSVV